MRKRKSLGQHLIDIFCYILGCGLYAVSLTCFAEPKNIVTGGAAGIALILNHLTAFPIGATVFLLNIPLFVLGFMRLGKSFMIKTFFVTALMSFITDISEKYLPKFNGDTILAALAGGVIGGAGLALIIIRGATSGGTDIIAKLISLKRPNISFGRITLISDAAVVCLSAIVYRNLESILYSVVMIFVSATVIDYFIYGTKNGKILLAITDRYEQIYKEVSNSVRRGATLIPAFGAYTGKDRKILTIVVRPGEMGKIYEIINRYDKDAFITLIEARDIAGYGFGSKKK